jgi:hypothetical protein
MDEKGLVDNAQPNRIFGQDTLRSVTALNLAGVEKPQGAVFPPATNWGCSVNKRNRNFPHPLYHQPNRIGAFVPTCAAPANALPDAANTGFTEPLRPGSSPGFGRGQPRVMRANTMPLTWRYRVQEGWWGLYPGKSID